MADKPRIVEERTVSRIKNEPRVWEEAKPSPAYFVVVEFEGGEKAEVRSTERGWKKHHEILSGLAGKPVTFTLQDEGTYPSSEDRRPWKILDYPGKPQGGERPAGSTSWPGSGGQESPEHRASIEAQKAAAIASALVVAGVGALEDGDTRPSVAQLAEEVERGAPIIARAILAAKAVLLPASVDAPAETSPSQRGDEGGSSGGAVSSTSGPAAPAPTNGDTPAATAADLVQLRAVVLDRFGTESKAVTAYNKAHRTSRRFSDLTAEDLVELAEKLAAA